MEYWVVGQMLAQEAESCGHRCLIDQRLIQTNPLSLPQTQRCRLLALNGHADRHGAVARSGQGIRSQNADSA